MSYDLAPEEPQPPGVAQEGPPLPGEPLRRSLSTEIDQDLQCVGCGYNLRGQPGDPKRCPECGLDNRLQDLLLPAQRIAKQMRRLETAPTYCFAGLLAGFIGHWIFLATLNMRNDLIVLSAIWGPMVLFAYVALPLGIRRFAATCLHQPGWGWALFKYNLYAVVIFVLGLVAIPYSFYLPIRLVGRLLWGGRGIQAMDAISAIICFVLVWVIAILGIRWCYRGARDCIRPLQRQIAVEMYHREALQHRS